MTHSRTRSTTRPNSVLLFVCSFAFAIGLSGTALAANCTPQAVLTCERGQGECLQAGRDPAICQRIYERCMEDAGCEIP